MSAAVPESSALPRWLTAWAKLTVCATFVLLALGAVVTTFQVGMADPIWPTYPWYLLLVSWEEPKPGFLIEHTHRLAGYVVGCCIIVLAVGLWRRDARRGVRWLGFAALLGVIVQGLLGGFRVKLDQWFGPNLAMVHGSFAPVVFATLAALAVVTTRGWRVERTVAAPAAVRWLALITAGLIYVQIILGALVRHSYWTPARHAHLMIAFLVAAAVVWLAQVIFGRYPRGLGVRLPAGVLVGLVAVQVMLGVEAWMFKFMEPGSLAVQAAIRTAHVLVGALMLATAVIVSLQVYRRSALAAAPALAPAGQWEGAA